MVLSTVSNGGYYETLKTTIFYASIDSIDASADKI